MSPAVKAKLQGFFKHAAIAVIMLLSLKYSVLDGVERERRLSFSKSAGLAALNEDEASLNAPVQMRHESSFALLDGAVESREAKTASAATMIVKTSDLSLVARVPVEEMARIEREVRSTGGMVMSSAVEKRPTGADSVQMLLRVPVDRFEEVRAAIKKGVLRVDRDSVEARDVTKDFVDSSAQLLNLRAREEQYRAILRQAHTVKDILEVTEKLSEVRGEIEALQGHLNYLKNQAEMSTLRVSIQAEADAQVAGITWRPLYQLRAAMMSGVAGLTDYANTMFVLLFRVPAILLWLLTLLLGAMIAWRVTLWVWTRLKSMLTPVAAKTA